MIKTPKTPRPHGNVISNGNYSLMISQNGTGYSFLRIAAVADGPGIPALHSGCTAWLPKGGVIAFK